MVCKYAGTSTNLLRNRLVQQIRCRLQCRLQPVAPKWIQNVLCLSFLSDRFQFSLGFLIGSSTRTGDMPMRMSCYYMQTVTVLVYHSVLVQVTLDFELELGVPDFQIDYTVDFIAPNRILHQDSNQDSVGKQKPQIGKGETNSVEQFQDCTLILRHRELLCAERNVFPTWAWPSFVKRFLVRSVGIYRSIRLERGKDEPTRTY